MSGTPGLDQMRAPKPESKSAFGLFNFLVVENIGLLRFTWFGGCNGASNAVELAGDQLFDLFFDGVRDELAFRFGPCSSCLFLVRNWRVETRKSLWNSCVFPVAISNDSIRTLPDSFDAQQELHASEQAFVSAVVALVLTLLHRGYLHQHLLDTLREVFKSMTIRLRSRSFRTRRYAWEWIIGLILKTGLISRSIFVLDQLLDFEIPTQIVAFLKSPFC